MQKGKNTITQLSEKSARKQALKNIDNIKNANLQGVEFMDYLIKEGRLTTEEEQQANNFKEHLFNINILFSDIVK